MGQIFPVLYDLAMKPLEATRFKQIRRTIIQHAAGKVLEIGSGTGVNFPFYRDAEQVTAVEPDPQMYKRAMKRGKKADVKITLYDSNAESLPFADNTFDTVIATLVFCTIPDPVQALEEIKRVSKPEARILFFEHVRLNQPLLGRLQDLLNPIWENICEGCQLNRDTLSLIQQSGIQVENLNTLYAGLFLSIECRN